MRGVSTSVVISTIVLVSLVTFAATAHSWTSTVENATACTIKAVVIYGAVGRFSKTEYIEPNSKKIFDTGGDCPLNLQVTHQGRDSQGKCNGSYTINAERCFCYNYSWNGCMHACWNSTWKIVGTTSDNNDMQRTP
jgi:hypothetical protein